MSRISQTQKLITMGLFLCGALVVNPVRGFAYTVVTINSQTAGTLGFSSAAEELNIYSTRNMFYNFRYDSLGVNSGYITATFSAFTGNEVAAPVPPGRYKFTLSYDRPGTVRSDPIYWRIFIGFRNYPEIYIYGQPYSWISYGQTINGEITVADVGQTRKLLKFQETDNQTNLVGQMLKMPLKVKVADSGGVGKEGIDVVFSVTPADSNCSFSESSVVKTLTVTTLADGTVEVPFKLGDVPETCTIKAVCASCSAGKEVFFTATARDKALTCAGGICSLHGHVSETFSNPFIVRVIDKLTGQSISGVQISYEVIRFVDSNRVTHTGANGGTMGPNPAITEAGGAYSYFTPGAGEGTYVIRAYCANCMEGPEQILYAGAGAYVREEMEEAITADPSANEANCPSGCCPVTPLVRMGMIHPPNDGISFTSAANENKIGLDARVLPACLNADDTVVWEVADAPGDFIDSGTPAQPTAGQISYFTVGSGTFPPAPTGRPLPLSYKVTANIVHQGVPKKSVAIVRQDEIDKCRQEYIDFGIPLTEVARNRFDIGLDGLGTPYDCYAHIFPKERYDEVVLLREIFTIRINSGYRSPRANKFVAGSNTLRSWHMFGRAIDIEVLPETPLTYYSLWTKTKNPKLLENSQGYLVKRDSSGNLIIGDDGGGYPVPFVFFDVVQSGWMHLGE